MTVHRRVAVVVFLALAAPISADAVMAQSAIAAAVAKPVSLPDIVIGSPKAPITITEYASMSCSHCAAFGENVFPMLRSKYIDTGKVRFVFREFPLDIKAATASILACCIGKGDSEKSLGVIETLFKLQERLVAQTKETLLFVGKLNGMSEQEVEACASDQAQLDKLSADQQYAVRKSKVISTPTFFLNGVKLEGSMPFEDLEERIKPLLRKWHAPAIRSRPALFGAVALVADGANKQRWGRARPSDRPPYARIARSRVAGVSGVAAASAPGLSHQAGPHRGRVYRRRADRRHRPDRGPESFSDGLGHQFVVENIGWRRRQYRHAGQVARAPADGYTTWSLLELTVNPSLYAKVPYDAVKDFAPVTLVAVSPNVVVVNPSVPAKTVPELVRAHSRQSGKYSIAGPGVGSTPHLGGELFRLAFKLDLVHVPFAGAGSGDPGRGRRPHADRVHRAAARRLPAVQAGQLRAPRCRVSRARRGGCPTCRPLPNRASRIRNADTLTGHLSRRRERRRRSSTCSIARSPRSLLRRM